MTSYDELAARIGEVAAGHGGTLPTDQAAAWAGYVGALLEWGHLPVADHGRLLALLGSAAARAVVPIFLGADEPSGVTRPIGFPTVDDAVNSGRRGRARTGTHG